jgi:hypothetical protein
VAGEKHKAFRVSQPLCRRRLPSPRRAKRRSLEQGSTRSKPAPALAPVHLRCAPFGFWYEAAPPPPLTTPPRDPRGLTAGLGPQGRCSSLPCPSSITCWSLAGKRHCKIPLPTRFCHVGLSPGRLGTCT